jgi:hypothetical protein
MKRKDIHLPQDKEWSQDFGTLPSKIHLLLKLNGRMHSILKTQTA